MSHKDREDCRNPAQHFYPMEMHDALSARLGVKPSVGAMALDMLVRLTDAPITLFGFDFKRTTTFYRRRENRGSHNWETERCVAFEYIGSGRVTLSR